MTSTPIRAASSPARVRTPAARGTSRALSLRHRLLLVATIAMLGGSLLVLQEMSQSFNEAHSRTAPAILEIAQARQALAEADRAAVASFRSPESELTGFRPGEEYQNQIGIANQSLAQAAEDNSAGALGSRILQTVEGMLVAYTSWIGQAGAQFRQGDTALSTANLWYASALMHNEADGILAQLETLQGVEQGNLDEKLSLGWIDLVTVVIWVGPIVLVFLLLWGTQNFLAQRFRRTVNPQLLVATVLVLAGLGTGGVLVSGDRGHLAAARDSLDQAVRGRDDEVARAGRERLQAFDKLIRQECADDTGGCGPTVATFLAGGRNERSDSRKISGVSAIAAGKRAAEQTDAARVNPAYAFPVVAMPLAVFVLILWGFRARIDEYRYRPR
jgi:hypothetical protein